MATQRQMEKQWFLDKRQELYNLAQGEETFDPMFGSSFGGGWLGGDPMNAIGAQGGQVARGTTPSDVDVQNYIKGLGGNPYSKSRQKGLEGRKGASARQGQMGKAAGAKAQQDASGALDDFLDEAQRKIEEANNANEERYYEIVNDLTARYMGVMGRIRQFGSAARQDLEERAAEGLENIQANLSARGLGGSTIIASFQQRNQRDLAREQTRLSENLAQREAEWMAKLSGDIAGFKERREDVAPDYGQLLKLAQQYGLSGAGAEAAPGGGAQGGPAPQGQPQGQGIPYIPQQWGQPQRWPQQQGQQQGQQFQGQQQAPAQQPEFAEWLPPNAFSGPGGAPISRDDWEFPTQGYPASWRYNQGDAMGDLDWLDDFPDPEEPTGRPTGLNLF